MVLQDLERSSQPVTPFGFLMQLREKYPQFAQQRNGLFMQQDAEECWTQLIYSLRERLKVLPLQKPQPCCTIHQSAHSRLLMCCHAKWALPPCKTGTRAGTAICLRTALCGFKGTTCESRIAWCCQALKPSM